MKSSFLTGLSKWRNTGPVVAVAALLLIAVLAAAGCGRSESGGQWADDSGATWEFTSDGRMLSSDAQLAGAKVTYTIEGDVLTVSAMGTEFLTAKFAVDGDTLRLTNPAAPSEVETMRRVK